MVDRVTKDVSYNIVYDGQGAQNISFRGLDYTATSFSEDLIPLYKTTLSNSNIFNIYNSTSTITSNGAARPSVFGVSSLGGDFEIKSSKPTEELEGELHTTIANDSVFNNLTIGTKQKSFYVQSNLTYLNRNSYKISDDFNYNSTQATNERVNSDKEYLGASIKLGYYLNDNDEVGFKYASSKSEYGNETNVYLTPFYTRVLTQDLNSFYGFYDHKNKDYSLKTRVYLDKYEDVWAIYDDNTFTSINGTPVLYDDKRTGFLTKLDLLNNGFSFVANYEQNQHISKNKYPDGEPKYVYETINGSVLYKKTYNNISVNSALTYKKYRPVKVDYDGHTFDYPQETGAKGDTLDAQVSLNYDFNDSTYYVSLTKTTKLPKMIEMYSFSDYQEPNPDLKPETSRNVEFGIKHSLKNGLISAAIYNYDIKDKIDSISIPDPRYKYYYNIDKATHRGFELRYSNLFYGKNFLNVEYAYSDAREENGDRLESIPENKLTISDEIYITRKLSTLIEVNYQSQMDDEDSNKIKAYSLVNIHGTYKIKNNISTTLSVKNLLDKNYEYKYGMPSLGRTVYASLNWKF